MEKVWQQRGPETIGHTMQRVIPQQWREALWLEHRSSAECVSSIDQIEPGPYAGPIRDALKMGLAAIFCIEKAPSVAILVVDEDDPTHQINSIHHSLWNQGLADLLLIIQGDILRVLSLWKRPKPYNTVVDNNDERFIESLHRISDALELHEYLSGVESGRLIQHHRYISSFDVDGRVDQTLLRDLEAVRDVIVGNGVSTYDAHELLLQTMFLVYLWDREIIDSEYLKKCRATSSFNNLEEILLEGSLRGLSSLLARLAEDFNGNMFSCDNLENWSRASTALREFVNGKIDPLTRQGRLIRLYQFDHIPVELLSEVYDRFLEADGDKRDQGAYYTPRRLAALVADQAWEQIASYFNKGKFPRVLDPACGSGIFLVALFHRMVSSWSISHNVKPDWSAMKKMAESLHGVDENPTAVRIASFSLSLAILDEEDPRQIQKLMEQGKILPKLRGGSLHADDFFNYNDPQKYHLIIGNPPWGKIRNDRPATSGEKWCANEDLQCPDREMAWPFAWRAPRLLTDEGTLVFLLPTTRFFYNSRSEGTLKKWLSSGRLIRMIDLSDMRELLFPKAKVPACIVVFSKHGTDGPYSIEHWGPKADINTKHTSRITLAPTDRKKIQSTRFLANPSVTCKQAMWASAPELNLLRYLEDLPQVGDLILPTKQARTRSKDQHPIWGIGEGFNKLTKSDFQKGEFKELKILAEIPFLPIEKYEQWVLPYIDEPPYESTKVSREKFHEGFYGPHILIPTGIEKVGPYAYRLRAAYTEQTLSYEHGIRSITVPTTSEGRAKGKLLTAILNSKLITWYLFLTGRAGADREQVPAGDIRRLPFPLPEDSADPKNAQRAFDNICSIIDELNTSKVRKSNLLGETDTIERHSPSFEAAITKLDKLVFEYFGLTPEDQSMIEECLDLIRPAMHPGKTSIPAIWGSSFPCDWEKYCDTFSEATNSWMQPDIHVAVSILAATADIVICKASLQPEPVAKDNISSVGTNLNLSDLSIDLREVLMNKISQNIQVIRELRFFIGDDLYLVKPRERRFWLSSVAQEDADSFVADLLFYNAPPEGAL